MNKWIAEFDLEDGDTMPEHMDLNYMGAQIDFHCRPMWIPCSERLPDKRGFYLITFKTGGDGRSVVMKFYRTESNLWTDDGMNRGFYLLPDEVTAWMPLPEPKEAEEGE